MPAYNFKTDFIPPILDLVKLQTIRKPRKRPTVAGDRIYMYTGLRTPRAMKFAESVVVRVIPVIVYTMEEAIEKKDGTFLSRWELELLARRDGFESVSLFFYFFLETYKQIKIRMEIIEWSPENLVRMK